LYIVANLPREVLAFGLTNIPSSGRDQGHVAFLNFGKLPIISLKRCKIGREAASRDPSTLADFTCYNQH